MDQSNSESKNGLFRTALELSKARLSILVVWTTATGAIAARGENHPLLWKTLLLTVMGTALAAASASVLNQVLEAHRDAKMKRTEKRPIPRGAIGQRTAWLLGLGLAAASVALLWPVGLLPLWLSMGTIALYAAVYTPLKPLTSLNTLVGAVVGAVPPMIGWAAVRGEVDGGAWVLAGILFVWQIPHFLALAWMYRDDYAKGGFQMLPAVDPEGILTARVTLIGSLALVPVSLSAFLAGFAGPIYAVVALVCGLLMVTRSVRMLAEPTRDNARNVFLASLLHLPLTLGALATGW
ncbi:MAG: protoheme IX farnesyltransferase [Phycisphaerae bacterium]|nr:protoheme IX farnesyltransferase [Phycisphaerae bacterium]